MVQQVNIVALMEDFQYFRSYEAAKKKGKSSEWKSPGNFHGNFHGNIHANLKSFCEIESWSTTLQERRFCVLKKTKKMYKGKD